MDLQTELFNLLVCPECKGKVELTDDGSGLVCKSCQLRYEIRDGIPVMLAGETPALMNPL
jgi:uncharacterized protein YbaR (Trm112 family)